MIALAFIIYALILLGIGLYSSSQAKNSSDFMVGGRGVNYIITAISAHASDMGSWLFFGFPVAVYLNGTSECWAALGLILGMWATWRFIAPQIRTLTAQSNSVTLSHFFAHRSGDTSGLTSLISASASLFFFLFYIASGLKGISTVLHVAFGLDPLAGIIIAASVVVAYTSLGGYLAVALTDTFQGIFLLAMILLVPFAMYFNLPATDVSQSLSFSFSPHFSCSSLTDAFIVAVSWGLGYCGLPHVLTKFMGIDSVKNMRKAQYVGLAWQTLALGAALSIGLLGQRFFLTPPVNPEHLFITAVAQLFSPLMVGFILCAILAATISTVDSQVIVSATIITKDLCSPRSAHQQIWMLRASIATLTGCAVVIAAHSSQTLYEIVRYAWSGLGSTFGPAVIASIYYRAITPSGMIGGMLTGALVSAVWPFYGPFLINAPMIPGFMFGSIVLVSLSILTRRTA